MKFHKLLMQSFYQDIKFMNIDIRFSILINLILLIIILGMVITFMGGVMVGKADSDRVCLNEIRLRDMALGRLNTNDTTFIITNFLSGEYNVYNDSIYFTQYPLSLLGGG